METKGFVYIAGAGCGGKEQLTIQVYELIQKCDVILYDSLLDSEILSLNSNAQKIYTGKRKGQHSYSQDQINALMVEFAKKGKQVLRLKGGDPFVFGRGMEEYQYCIEHEVHSCVLPGLSSCISIPERAGIPVTSRDVSSSFMVVSGHTKDPAVLLSEDVSLLAAFQGTLVVLMGVSKLKKICAALIEHGRGKDTPAALISSKEIKRSQTLQGTLATLPDLYNNNPLPTPAVLVIGKAAAFSFENEKWIGSTCTPEFNKKIEQYLPGNYHLYSCMDCTQTSIPFSKDQQELLLDLNNTWLIFTSAKGIKTFIEQYLQKHDIRNLFPCKIACIGQGTAQALFQYGLRADFIGINDTTKSMAHKLQAVLNQKDRIFTIREKNAGFQLEEILSQSQTVHRFEVYALDYKAKDTENNHVLIFGSSRQIKEWFQSNPVWNRKCKPICISAECAELFSNYCDVPVYVAKDISAKGLAQIVLEIG